MPTCPVGQVWNDALGACVPIPALPLTPPNPPVVESWDCETGVVLSSGVWDATSGHEPTHIDLYRTDITGKIHTFDNDSDTWTDASAVSPGSYTYYTRARNDWGQSASPSSTVTQDTALDPSNLEVTLSVVPQSPGVEPYAGKLDIIATVTGSDTLDGVAPLALTVNGTAIAATVNEGDDHEFSAVYDTAAGRAVGTSEFKAVAKNDAGCKSAPATVSVDVDNSMLAATGWEVFARTAAKAIVRAGVFARIAKALNDASDRFYEFRVLSPAQSLPAHDGDWQTNMQALFNSAQPWKLGTRNALDGTVDNTDGSYTQPDATMQLIVKRQPVEAVTNYDTGSERVIKMRYQADNIAFVFCAGPFRALHFDGNGLGAVADVSGILDNLPDATDACYVNSHEMHLVNGGQINIADLDSGQVTIVGSPLLSDGTADPFTPTFVERVGGAAHWVFVGESASRVYRYVAGAVRVVANVPHPVTYCWVNDHGGDSALLLVCGTHLYALTGDTLTRVYDHTQNITGAHITEKVTLAEAITEQAIQFVDDTGEIWQVTALPADPEDEESNGTAISLGTIGVQGNALGRFQGGATAVRSAAGGETNELYLQDDAGAFPSTLAFESGATVTALQRLLVTVTPGNPNALPPVPAVVDESLLVGVTPTQDLLHLAEVSDYDNLSNPEYLTDFDPETSVSFDATAPYIEWTWAEARWVDRLRIYVSAENSLSAYDHWKIEGSEDGTFTDAVALLENLEWTVGLGWYLHSFTRQQFKAIRLSAANGTGGSSGAFSQFEVSDSETPIESYVARLQRTLPTDFMYRGQGVRDIFLEEV